MATITLAGTTLRFPTSSAVVGILAAGTRLVKGRIGWAFDTDVEYGYYIDGSPFIVVRSGTVDLDAIEYQNNSDTWVSGGPAAGSMLNLSVANHGTTGHGLASDETTYYNASYNETLNLPLALGADDTVISAGNPRASGSTAAVFAPNFTQDVIDHTGYFYHFEVLTVVGTAPALDDFRPGYADTGSNASPANKADINYGIFANVSAIASGLPTLSEMEDELARPWAGIGDNRPWSRYTTAYFNQNDYGAYQQRVMCDAMIYCNTAESTDSELENLVINLCQRGIDFYSLAVAGYSWSPNGGTAQCSKGPIVFAGGVLGIAAMRDVGTTYTHSLDTSLFRVNASDVSSYDYGDADESGSGGVTANSGTYLEVSGASWDISIGAPGSGNDRCLMPGMIVRNVTTGAEAILTVTTNSSRVEHTQLTGGSRQTWLATDDWAIEDLGMIDWYHTARGAPGRIWYADGTDTEQVYRAGAGGETADNWHFLLAIELMGLKSNWNNDDAFEYIERWEHIEGGTGAWRSAMYRKDHTWEVYPDPN